MTKASTHKHSFDGLLGETHISPDDTLATADLPPRSYLPSRPQFSAPQRVTNSTGLSAPNIINYRLRSAFANESTAKRGLDAALVTCQDHWQWEQDNFFDIRDEITSRLDRISPYLANQLSDIIDQAQLTELRNNRRWWYEHYLPDKLKQAATNANSYLQTSNADIRSILVVSESTFSDHANDRSSPPPKSQICTLPADTPAEPSPLRQSPPGNSPNAHVVVSEAFLKEETDQYPTKYKFKLPQHFLGVRSGSRDFYHLLLPWYGINTCTCEYATQPSVPLCKHEIAVLAKSNSKTHHIEQYNGPTLHPRFTRTVPQFTDTSLSRLTPQ